MNNFRSLALIPIFTFFTMFSSLEASPVFAKQYEMKCSACHVNLPPMLNDTGMKFLRNGFRFSQSDTTTYERTSSADKEKQIYPVAAFLSGVYSSELEKTYPQAILFLTGSLTETTSLFAGLKLGIIDKNPEETDEKELTTQEEKNKLMIMGAKVYLQYNLDDKSEQVIRAGIVTPTTPFGNIRKATEHALVSNLQAYKSPLSIASTKPIVGGEYSYLHNEKTLFYVAAGMKPGSSPGQEIAAGVGYKTDGGFKYGAIYQKIMGYDDNISASLPQTGVYDPDLRVGNRDTLIIQLEKDFGLCYINSSIVYKKDDWYKDDYYGVENGITFPFWDTDSLRFIANIDKDNRVAVAGTYSKFISDILILSASAEKIETEIYKDNIFEFTVSYVLY